DGVVPGAAARALGDGDGVRPDVGGEELALVVEDIDHVGGALAGAEEHVDLVRGGVVAGDDLVALGGEVGFLADGPDAVRAGERRDVDSVQLFAAGDV